MIVFRRTVDTLTKIEVANLRLSVSKVFR